MTSYTDLVARVRGLSTHLLPDAAYAVAAESRDLRSLVAQLTTFHVLPPMVGAAPPAPGVLESALRRRAGARLRIIERWAGERADALSPLWDDEDRRSLRTLLRGAMAGVAAEARIESLVPTSALPLRALDELARLGDATSFASALLTWQHPFAHALAEAAHRPHPDLFHLELALARAFAERATRAARHTDEAMRHFAARVVDLDNVWSALLLSQQPMDVDATDVFLDGGRIVTRDDLTFALESHNQAALLARLGPRVRGTPLADALEPDQRNSEDAALQALITEFTQRARRDPLSLAPVVLFVLRQRAELRALTRLIWSCVLGVPAARVTRALGSAA